MVIMPDGRKLFPWDDEFRVSGSIGFGPKTHEVAEHLEKRFMPFKELYTTFEEFVEGWHEEEKDPDMLEYGYWHNPNAKWDWYVLGGRWAGYFKVREGIPDNLYEVGKKGLMDSCRNDGEGYADRIQKKNIDLEGMRAEIEKEASEFYDLVERVVGDAPIPITLDFAESKFGNVGEARKFYYNQEAVRRLGEDDELLWYSVEDLFLQYGLEEGRKRYIENAFCRKFVPFAVLMNGEWYERGKMGWWGVVFDEELTYDWSAKFMELWESIPDDEWVSIIDCHI